MTPYETIQWKLGLKEFFAEPDYVNTCAFGLPVKLRRNRSKAWCGYVGIPSAHPLFGRGTMDEIDVDPTHIRIDKASPIVLMSAALAGKPQIGLLFNTHGSLTWAADHPATGLPDGRWWFGFDCSHHNDLTPRGLVESFCEDYPFTTDQLFAESGAKYRNVRYALREARNLAEGLAHFPAQS